MQPPRAKHSLPASVYAFTLLAFALRLFARLHTGAEDFFANGYTFFFAMAQNIAAGKGIALAGVPTAFRVPLYPIFLAALTAGHKWFWPILLAESLVGAATVLCAARLALDMFDARAAILAAAITAIYPYYLIHDTALQETSLFTLLTLVSIIVLRRAAQTGSFALAAEAGLLLGLDVLTRSTIAPFAVIAPIWLAAISVGGGQARLSRTQAALCALVLAATVAPWLWRNYQLTGTPTLATEAGTELWNGNNAFLFRHYPKESSDLSKAEALAALTAEDRAQLAQIGANEALRDGWFLRKGLSYMRANPGLTFSNGARKIAAGFGWLPSPRRTLLPNLVHAFSYGPVMLLGLYGMWRRRDHWREDFLIYTLFAVFICVSAVFFAHTSHRTYLDVYWIVFASGVLSDWTRRAPFSKTLS